MQTDHLAALDEIIHICIRADHDNPLISRLLNKLIINTEALDHQSAHGGYWGEHPPLESGRSILREDWILEVTEGNTGLGYWEWVVAQRDLDYEEGDEQSEAGS